MKAGRVPILDMPDINSQKPGSGLRILLTDTKRWAVGPRLGHAFASMGCQVAMLCPREGHPAHQLTAIQRLYAYRGADLVGSLEAAIHHFDPHLVLPTCDRGVRHLHRLYVSAKENSDRRTLDCIERSLGPAASFPVVASRYRLMMLAAEEGIAIPETVAIENEDDLRRAGRLGFPLAIKASGTWGGAGVKIAGSAEEAVEAFRELVGRSRVPWLVKELLLNRDRANTVDDWRQGRPSIVAQKWIEGHPANCAVACRDGKVLAGVAVEVLATNGEIGPASLVEVVPGDNMMDAATRIARRLKLQGFIGLDFMIERGTGTAYLIEMNARCTQVASLTMGKGHNLPAAMCASLNGMEEPETEAMTRLRRIAYFPKPSEWADPEGNAPEPSYHYDLPANEPAFVERMLNQWPDRGRLGRWLDRMRDSGSAGGASTSALKADF